MICWKRIQFRRALEKIEKCGKISGNTGGSEGIVVVFNGMQSQNKSNGFWEDKKRRKKKKKKKYKQVKQGDVEFCE